MRRRARLILERQDRPKNELDNAFPPLGVLYFPQGGSASAGDVAVAKIEEIVREHRIGAGFASGLGSEAFKFTAALTKAGAIVTLVVPDEAHRTMPEARVVHLRDWSEPQATDAQSCEDAAREAAGEMARLLDESVRVLSVEGGVFSLAG